jgi:hypothetical protein
MQKRGASEFEDSHASAKRNTASNPTDVDMAEEDDLAKQLGI